MPVPESVVPPAVTNESVEPKQPEAEFEDTTRMVVSPSIEAPQPSADPAPEVPEVPQIKPEVIPPPKIEAKPEVKTEAEPQTEISFVSAEDQKAIEGFLTSVSEWVSEARNVDMDRRQLIAKSIPFNPQDADQEVEVIQALKQAQDLTAHLKKIQLMNLRRKEVLTSDVVNQWALDAAVQGAVIDPRFRPILKQVHNLELAPVSRGATLADYERKVVGGNLTPQDVENLGEYLVDSLRKLRDSRRAELIIDEAFLYLPTSRMNDLGFTQFVDTSLAYRRVNREAARLATMLEFCRSHSPIGFPDDSADSEELQKQFVINSFADILNDIEHSFPERESAYRINTRDYSEEMAEVVDYTVEELWNIEEQARHLYSLIGKVPRIDVYSVWSVAATEERLNAIERRQSEIWNESERAALTTVIEAVEKTLGKRELEFVQEAVEAAAKGEILVEVPRPALQYDLWKDVTHTGKYLGAILRITEKKHKTPTEAFRRMPEALQKTYRETRDRVVLANITEEEKNRTSEMTKAESTAAEFLSSGEYAEATQSLQRLIELGGRQPEWCLLLAKALLESKQFAECERELTSLVMDGDVSVEVFYLRALCRYRMGEFEAAVADAWSLQELTPDASEQREQEHLLIANMLACSENDKVRNGPVAVSIAETYCKQTQWKSTLGMECLAKGLAECKRTEEALKILARIEKPSQATASIKMQIEQGKPVRITF